MKFIDFIVFFILPLLAGWKILDLILIFIKRIKEGRYIRKYNCVRRNDLIISQINGYQTIIDKIVHARDTARLQTDMNTFVELTHLMEDVIHIREEYTYKFDKLKKGDAKLDGNSKIRRDD